ncbi:MAG: hypothetical protein B7Y80_16245 [Hyphomicrobium sp. 32-62-53]|nr:MAG: hypothetical protein B7Z29_18940 [Hyphomicrobium sp. 12-62-95]OYX98288.1 MAG: hypothetical protein B7Y80_16245 [Hyphomicrobium sp. 32-62-53]
MQFVADGELSTVKAGATWGRRVWALVKAVVPTILIFLAVGPVIGYFAIMLPIAMTATGGPLGPLEGLVSTLGLLPLGALFAYMIGYGPALVTGAAVALADCVVDLGSYRTPAAIVLGAGVTLVLFLGISELPDRPRVEALDGAASVAAAIGAMAAGVCAMIAPRRAPVWPAA